MTQRTKVFSFIPQVVRPGIYRFFGLEVKYVLAESDDQTEIANVS